MSGMNGRQQKAEMMKPTTDANIANPLSWFHNFIMNKKPTIRASTPKTTKLIADE